MNASKNIQGKFLALPAIIDQNHNVVNDIKATKDELNFIFQNSKNENVLSSENRYN